MKSHVNLLGSKDWYEILDPKTAPKAVIGKYRVKLLQDVTFTVYGVHEASWETRYIKDRHTGLEIVSMELRNLNAIFTLKAGYMWDAATLLPLDNKKIWWSLPHDATYQMAIELLKQGDKYLYNELKKAADKKMYKDCLRSGESKIMAKIYTFAVKRLYPIWVKVTGKR